MSDSELIFEVAYRARAGKSAPRAEEIRKGLSLVEGLQLAGRTGSKVHRYFNPETQVEFDFVQYPPDGRYVGLSFEMELPRPLFFALEALPIVVQVARELSLDVEILSPENDMPVGEPTFELLVQHWQLANREEVEALASDGEARPRLGNQALEGMWEFMLLRTDLARRYARSHIQVPPVEMWCEIATGEAQRVVRWTRLSATAVAECDYVLLEDPPAPLVHHSLLPFSALREQAKFACRDLSQPVFHRLFDKSRVQEELIQALTVIEGRSLDEFEPIGYRMVVDESLTPLLDD
jgi:hypothetical protein